MNGHPTRRKIQICSQMSTNDYVLTIFLSEPTGLHESDFSVCVQILLIPDQDNDNVGAGKCPSICQPVGQGIVRLPTNGGQQ